VYALISWAFLTLLLRMRLRWRRQDAQLARETTREPDATPERVP